MAVKPDHQKDGDDPNLFTTMDPGGFHNTTIAGINYLAVRRRGLNWEEAKAYCEANNQHLVEFQTEQQYKDVWDWLTSLSGSGEVGKDMDGQAYWIGYKENSKNDLKSNMNLDDFYTKWVNDEPNDAMCAKEGMKPGCEKCIRMRRTGIERYTNQLDHQNKTLDGMNDAICGRTHVGAKKGNDPMSFICQDEFAPIEYDDSPLCPSAYTGTNQPQSGCYVQNEQCGWQWYAANHMRHAQ